MQKENSEVTHDIAVKLFILIASIALLVAGQAFFIPFILAIFLTFLLHPVSNRLERWKFPKVLAIIISILVAVIAFGSLIYFFFSQVANFQEDLPELKKQLVEKSNRALHWISEKTNIESSRIESWLVSKIKDSEKASTTLVLGIFSLTGTVIAMMGLIPIYAFFMTYFKEKYISFVKLIYKEKDKHTHILNLLEKISTVSKNYLKGVFIDVLILSVLGSIGYMLLGIKHAILFGVLAAMLNIIPYIGVLVGSLLPVMMALITKDEMGYAIGAMGVAVVVQFLDNNFIAPYIIGSSVSINPLTAIVVLVIGALIWGIAGMVLSIPLAGVIKVICDNVESLKPYGYLIGEEVNFRKRKIFTK